MKKYKIKVNNQSFNVEVEQVNPDTLNVNVNNNLYSINVEEILDLPQKNFDEPQNVYIPVQSTVSDNIKPNDNILRSPVNGVIVDVKIKEGDTIKNSDVVCVIEAMKMESEIFSSVSGKVKKLFVKNGDSIKTNDKIIEVIN
jgi:biotin carboxyl carrier protein